MAIVVGGDFTTHLNYIRCMDNILDGISIQLTPTSTITLDKKRLAKFEKLAVLTSRSIKNELLACHAEPEYAAVVAPWIPVKCYYLTYYLESVCIHLNAGTMRMFKHGGHTYVRNAINNYLSKGLITTTQEQIEKLVPIGAALKHKIQSGTNIRSRYYLSEECVKSVRSKIADYIERQWKESQNIKGYYSKESKLKRDQYYQQRHISLLEFFMQMRLKANYKDIDYLDFENVITPKEAVFYVETYINAADKYAKALSSEITRLKSVRGM